MNNLRLNVDLGIYLPEKYDRFEYSDGDKNENYVLDILKKSSDNSIFSEVLSKAIKDWPSEYHLSADRSNIIRPIPIKSEFEILEVGGGCGAITRYLGETGAAVVSVEGSIRRAQCIRQRCKDLDNVSVYCSNIYDLSIDRKFDIITLIGVFEYSGKYSPFADPYVDSLNFYKKLLKPNGKIIIAIENQLGLKYFLGHEEDHLGKPFLGVQNKYSHKGVRTFGKEELIKIINDSGFNNYSFFYPFPDYKLPKVILNNDALSCDELNCSDLIYMTESRSYSDKYKPLYDEKLSWPVLERNQILGDMANSFLVVIQNSDTENCNYDLASLYTTNRSKYFNTETNFSRRHEEIIVKKQKLYDKKAANSYIVHKVSDTIYETGQNLEVLIYKDLQNGNLESFYDHIKVWISFLKEHALKKKSDKIINSIVYGEYFDCLPSNLIIKDKNLIYIDKEWLIDKEITLSYVILRYLFEIKSFRSFKRKVGSFKKFVDKVVLDSGLIEMNNAHIIKYKTLELEIKEIIYKDSRSGPWGGSALNVIAKKIKYFLTTKVTPGS